MTARGRRTRPPCAPQTCAPRTCAPRTCAPRPPRRWALAALIAAATPLAAAPGLSAAEHAVVRSSGPAVVEMRSAALIMSGQQGGALPIAVAVLPRTDVPHAVTAMVEIDGAALLEAAGDTSPLRVEVLAYVLGADLDVVDQQSLSLRVDPKAHRPLLAGTGLKAFVPLSGPPGAYQLRILTSAGEAFGLRGSQIVLPDADDASVRILPPIFHELDEPWLLALPADDPPLPPPFGLAGDRPLPTTRPLVATGTTIAVEILLAGKLPESWALAARVRRPAGDAVTAPLLAPDPPTATAAGLQASSAAFDSTGFAHGPWELAVALLPETLPEALPEASATAGDPPPPLAESSYVALFVEAAPDLSIAPRAAAGQPAPRAAPVSRRAPLNREQKQLRARIAPTYLEALRQLAGGHPRDAAATLRDLEVRAVELFDADAPAVLSEGETEIFATLENADWDCVLPVITLHLELGLSYREARRFILARHATRMTVELATTYARRLATPAAAREAAQALTRLAGHDQLRGSLTQATELFDAALRLAEDPAARLGVATLHEKLGRFDRALADFEVFVRDRPEHAEGRLRLALNRARTGDVDSARQLLEQLTLAEADWVAVVAHQELARLEVEGGRLPRAASLLGRALERWPGHPTLTLQLASVLDARGDERASRALLEELDLGSLTHGAGERSHYNRWPTDLLDAARRELAADSSRRLPRLAGWLERTAGEGGP